MELGYTGIAYNRTIKGIMSDHDRCCITPFSLSTLLNIAPSLCSSVNLHRDLLNVPRASPFRQYTRLTVCVDSPAQSHVLNRGNMILKSYDLVAVRPLNQLAFDYACEKSEVDIITIDFSEKLPFRLKLHMVKAAMERGVHFEITYSDLIVDVQVRRQMISNAKLLVDWTRGRNLIISSAAPSVNELRGPYDVANLSSLLGLSMERAKEAISKNCRNLVANALRKKHFYKETIRVEPISLDEKSDSKEPLSIDWLKWDPISSGEWDLQLEDIAKSFSATNKVSNSVKAIDFASVIDSISSHGANFLTPAKAVEVPVTATGASEKLGGHDLLPVTDCKSMCNFLLKGQTLDHGSSQAMPRDAATTSTSSEEIRAPTNATKEKPKNSNVSDAVLPLVVSQKHDLQLQDLINSDLNTVLANEDAILQTPAAENGLTDACVADTTTDILSESTNFLESQILKSMNSHAVLGTQNAVMENNIEKTGTEDQEDAHGTENASGRKQLREFRDAAITHVDSVPFVLTSGEVNDNVVSLVKNQEILEEVAMEEQEHGDTNLDISEEVAKEEHEHEDADTEMALSRDNDFEVKGNSLGAEVVPLKDVEMQGQKHEEADTESNHQTFVPSISGKSKSKQKTPLLFPLKRLLNPIPFKRKSKKFKRKMKVLQMHLPLQN
ncbi:protein with unknown function [Ricinus communis]|uniref:Uncharacterized protein n=1 Tax=Ricinus communis TaxID=3988 RepID=B9T3J0_RICCO|nr:protein with unknown function [Ricinus communis]